MKDAPFSAVLSRDGDTITSQNNVAGHKETLVFRLGEKFTTNTMGLNSEVVGQGVGVCARACVRMCVCARPDVCVC